MGIGVTLRSFGTTFLRGMCYDDWLALLKENRYAVSPRYLFRAAATTAISLTNSALRGGDDALLSQVRRTKIEPPLFVLGHFRSGTTFLHQLLSRDNQFAYPNVYEIHFPNTFLSTEDYLSKPLAWLLGNSFRDLDGVSETISSPAEDDWAICNMAGTSFNLSSVFPNRSDYYDRFLSFRDATAQETDRWRSAMLLFLQKLTWKYRRPLLLKSPPHTCKIALLLEMFPQARFVHIHRHPFDVFRSSRKMLDIFYLKGELQPAAIENRDDRVIALYQHMFEVFHQERHLIPPSNFAEIRYEDLVRNPVEEVKQLYERLGIAGFNDFEEPLRSVCESRRNYQTNPADDLPGDLKTRLAKAWKPSFDAWGYDAFSNTTHRPAPPAALGGETVGRSAAQCEPLAALRDAGVRI